MQNIYYHVDLEYSVQDFSKKDAAKTFKPIRDRILSFVKAFDFVFSESDSTAQTDSPGVTAYIFTFELRKFSVAHFVLPLASTVNIFADFNGLKISNERYKYVEDESQP